MPCVIHLRSYAGIVVLAVVMSLSVVLPQGISLSLAFFVFGPFCRLIVLLLRQAVLFHQLVSHRSVRGVCEVCE